MTASRRLLPAAALVVAAVPLLAGCHALGINTVSDTMYPTLEKAQESTDGAKIPQLVPDDARSIRVAYNTVDEGQTMAFTSEGGITADYCEAGAVSGKPAFEPGWWPTDELPRDGWTCGDWTVVESGTRFLVWD